MFDAHMILKRGDDDIYNLQVFEWGTLIGLASSYDWIPDDRIGWMYPLRYDDDYFKDKELNNNTIVDNEQALKMAIALEKAMNNGHPYLQPIIDFMKRGAFVFELLE